MYNIIDNPLIHSRPHIQHSLLEILAYIKDWCEVDLLLHHAFLHHASHFIIDRIQI